MQTLLKNLFNSMNLLNYFYEKCHNAPTFNGGMNGRAVFIKLKGLAPLNPPQKK